MSRALNGSGHYKSAAHNPQILSKYWVSTEGVLRAAGWVLPASLGRQLAKNQSEISTNSAGMSMKWNHAPEPPAAALGAHGGGREPAA